MTRHSAKPWTCIYCGMPTAFEPADQTPPADYCHAGDHESIDCDDDGELPPVVGEAYRDILLEARWALPAPPNRAALPSAPRNQRGLTLIEMTIATALTVILVVGAVGLVQIHARNTAANAIAQHALIVGRAGAEYTRNNTAALIASSTATVPTTVSIATLVAGDHLPVGFSGTNDAGQVLQLRVSEPTPGSLLALVVGTGGQAMDDGQSRLVANLIGASGGVILSTAPAVATGSHGGWGPITLSTMGGSPGAGRVVVNATVLDAASQ